MQGAYSVPKSTYIAAVRFRKPTLSTLYSIVPSPGHPLARSRSTRTLRCKYPAFTPCEANAAWSSDVATRSLSVSDKHGLADLLVGCVRERKCSGGAMMCEEDLGFIDETFR